MKYAKWIFAVTLTMLPILAVAQLGQNGTLTANVPFEFTVGNKRVPAGQCTVAMYVSPRTLMIRNVRAKVGLFSPASPAKGEKAAGHYALVFHRYGDQYFLSAIKIEGSRDGYQLLESKAEAELRTQNVPAAETILLASLQ